MVADELAKRFATAFDRLGFAFFERGDYNLNLIGVRASRAGAGLFDDQLFCLYKAAGVWRAHMWAITTDPGSRLLQHPIGAGGCLILAAPQQMRGAYVIGKHKGRDALVQHGGAVKVWRDPNRDTILDWGQDEGEAGWYGVNIHDATSSDVMEKNLGTSAGCQVFACRKEHAAMLDLCRVAARTYGTRFSYTLVTSADCSWLA